MRLLMMAIGGLGLAALSMTATPLSHAETAAAEPAPASALAKAAAELDRKTPFGSKILFAREPLDPPAFPIVGPDGAETTLAAHKGKVVVAIFWATWCHVCAKEMPQVDLVVATLKDSRITFLPVSLDAGAAAATKVEAWYKRKGIAALPIQIDKDRANANAIGLRATPTAFVIAPDGKLVAAIEGRGHWESPAALQFLKTLAEGASEG